MRLIMFFQCQKVSSNNELNAVIIEKIRTIYKLDTLARVRLIRLRELREKYEHEVSLNIEDLSFIAFNDIQKVCRFCNFKFSV